MTPRLLIHDRPRNGLEGKFSMPFCAAAAIVYGQVGVDTFDPGCIQDPVVRSLMPRVTMRVNPAFDSAAPLSRARVAVRLRDGGVLEAAADGARGYPGRVSEEELADKFAACARRVLSPERAARAWNAVQGIEECRDVRELMGCLVAD